MKIRVDCRAGYRGEETPIQIHLENRSIDVMEILDCWLAPDHRYFKIRGNDQAVYIIRHDVYRGMWELSFYNRTGKYLIEIVNSVGGRSNVHH